MELKKFIDSLKGIEVTEDNVEEVSELIGEAFTEYVKTMEEIASGVEERSYESLRSTVSDLDQLKGLLDSAKGLVEKVEKDVKEKEGDGKEEDSGKEEGTGKEEDAENAVGKGEERGDDKMAVRKRAVAGNEVGKVEYRENFQKFLKEKVIPRGLTTEDGGVILQTEDTYDFETEDKTDLTQLVTIENVSTGEGVHYEADYSSAPVMATVEELAESPEIGEMPFQKIRWEIKTLRAAIPGSNEASEDIEGFDVFVHKYASEVARKTKNREILKAINDSEDIETKVVTDIADFVTPGIPSKHRVGFTISESMYNKLARLKDSEGRYYLHNDLTKAPTDTLLGKPAVVLPDEEIGAETAIYGDLKAAVVLFSRKEITMEWEHHIRYGRVLQPVIRLDVKVMKPDAIVKLDIQLEDEVVDEGE